MLLPIASPARTALPAVHFDRNATSPVTDLVHQDQRRHHDGLLAKAASGNLSCLLASRRDRYPPNRWQLRFHDPIEKKRRIRFRRAPEGNITTKTQRSRSYGNGFGTDIWKSAICDLEFLRNSVSTVS